MSPDPGVGHPAGHDHGPAAGRTHPAGAARHARTRRGEHGRVVRVVDHQQPRARHPLQPPPHQPRQGHVRAGGGHLLRRRPRFAGHRRHAGHQGRPVDRRHPPHLPAVGPRGPRRRQRHRRLAAAAQPRQHPYRGRPRGGRRQQVRDHAVATTDHRRQLADGRVDHPGTTRLFDPHRRTWVGTVIGLGRVGQGGPTALHRQRHGAQHDQQHRPDEQRGERVPPDDVEAPPPRLLVAGRVHRQGDHLGDDDTERQHGRRHQRGEGRRPPPSTRYRHSGSHSATSWSPEALGH